MKVFKELLEIFGLLFTIGLTEVKDLSAKVQEQVKERGNRYLRVLIQVSLIVFFLPLGLLVVGFIIKQDIFFGLAGIVVCTALGIVLFGFYPLMVMLQIIFTHLKDIKDTAATQMMARRYLSGVVTLLLLECLITLYAIIFPLETNPSMIVTLIICFIMLTLLSMRYVSVVGGIIRVVSFVVVTLVLIVSTLSLVLPQTMGAVRDLVPSLDAMWEKSVSTLMTDSTNDTNSVIATKTEYQLVWSENIFTVPAASVDVTPTGIYLYPGDSLIITPLSPRKIGVGKDSTINDSWAHFKIYEIDWGSWGRDRFSGNPPLRLRIRTKARSIIRDQRSQGFNNRIWSIRHQLDCGTKGIWPEWVTSEQYIQWFRENKSRSCWNLTYQNGLGAVDKQISVGAGVRMKVSDKFELCFNINRMYREFWWQQGEGSYKVKVQILRAK